MKSLKTVLLIEDNPGDARLIREMFREHDKQDSELMHVECMIDAEKYLAQNKVGLILLDIGLPDAQGMEAVRRSRAAAPSTSLVVLTGLDDETLAARALQEGAQDYLIKGEIETRGLGRAVRYAKERKRLEQVKDEFIASVSHELRTPLTSISASLGLLMSNKTGADLSAPTIRLISIAHANSLRLVRLVNDILDIEKMDAGQTVFRNERVDVRQVVDQAIEANLGFAEEYGVRIVFQAAPDVIAVLADSGRLMQAITNLLSNAIKFSRRHGEVDVTIEKQATSMRISVRDRGPGISAEFKPRIFERFAQADASDSRLRGGTGLGLSIVKQIIDRLGGKVSFTDAQGGGTVFHLDLPYWVDEAGAATDLGSQLDALREIQRGVGAKPTALEYHD